MDLIQLYSDQCNEEMHCLVASYAAKALQPLDVDRYRGRRLNDKPFDAILIILAGDQTNYYELLFAADYQLSDQGIVILPVPNRFQVDSGQQTIQRHREPIGSIPHSTFYADMVDKYLIITKADLTHFLYNAKSAAANDSNNIVDLLSRSC